VSLAYIPSAGGTQTLPRHVPPGIAMQMILTGDPIDAEAALRHGLVQRVVPRERLYEEAEAFARRMIAGPAGAVSLSKRALRDGAEMTLEQGIALESRLAAQALASEDGMRGVEAAIANS
jgi:enoyl-CoA hydratase/carnithine racemase